MAFVPDAKELERRAFARERMARAKERARVQFRLHPSRPDKLHEKISPHQIAPFVPDWQKDFSKPNEHKMSTD